MKNILLLAFLAGATAVEAAPAAPAATTQTGQTPSQKEMKKKRKLARKNGPEVYKGTVANQSRIVNDAPGSEKDDESDGSSRKDKRKKQ